MNDNEQISKETAANIADITIQLAPLQSSFTPEQVNELLAKQRGIIAARIRALEGKL